MATQWNYERKGFNKLIAYPADPGTPSPSREEQPGLVLERTGFADWKLTEMRLPLPPKKNQLAHLSASGVTG
jgi:hypothetical protein